MKGTTPGWKTSEFWGKVGIQVTAIWGVVSGFLPAKYALIGGVALEAVYQISRTALKAYIGIKDAQAGSTTVTTTAPVTTITSPA